MQARDYLRAAPPFYVGKAARGLANGLVLAYAGLYFRTLGLSFLEIGILMSAFEGAIMLFEVPTGIYADRVGYRPAVLLGMTAAVLGGICYAYGAGSRSILLLGAVIHGLSESFLSGSSEAWGIRMSRQQLGEDVVDLEALLALGVQVRAAAVLLGLGIASLLLTSHLAWIWYLYAFMHGVGFLAIARYPSSQAEEREATERPAIRRPWQWNGMILALFGFTLGSELGFVTVDEFWQIFLMEDILVDPRTFAGLSALVVLFSLLMARSAVRWLRDRFHSRGALTILQITICASVGALSVARHPLWAMGLIVATSAVYSLRSPLIQGWLNRLCQDHERATIMSYNSLAGSMGEVGSGMLAGLLADSLGLRTAFRLGSLALLAACAFLLTGRKELSSSVRWEVGSPD